MEGTVEVTKKFHLTMNEKEASFIKGACQNPLFDDESPTEQGIREAIFTRLKKLGAK